MKSLGKYVVKHKAIIVLISFLLLIPALIGIKNTKINYDILVYLPSDIETLKGEKILTDDFNMGAFSVAIIDNMNSHDVLKLEDEIKSIDGVEKVVSINDITGTSIPIDVLPDDVVSKFKKGDTQLMLITFRNSTSDDETLDAVSKIRKITDDNVKLGGMSSMVLDTMELSNKEIVIYVVIAVLLCIVVLSIALDSYLVPFILLSNIGIAILYNMGTNVFLGNISYITKAISSVLQLGVTTDFSIFLYHKYEERKKYEKDKNVAMEKAISDTLISVVGSSLTTIAGFLALCTMSLTLGKDIGIVMAKGVFLGVVCVLIVFPALLLVFDKQIDKTLHKQILPKFTRLNDFIIKHYKKIFVIFLILLIPAYYGNKNTEVYYKLDKSLPDTLESSVANSTLKDKFNIVSAEMILIDKDIKPNTVNRMIEEIKDVEGIDMVLSGSDLNKYGINDEMLGNEVTSIYKSDKYQMILVNSIYDTATDELNSQITDINKIIKKYDKNGILAGEGPLMKDLVVTSDIDFNNVNYTSLFVIFLIMICVLKSISLPVLLICVIEFAIFVNMGIPYYTDVTIPFIASIVIGTIQLGATIDYAILMTTKYLDERKKGNDKYKSIKTSLDSSVSSILVSGMCFFAATFGVGVYSKLDMISSLCTLISRGAIVSMIVVIMVLPSFLLIFDKLICKTTKGFKKEGNKMNKSVKKLAVLTLALSVLSTSSVSALTKNETVFSHLDYNGKVKSTIVNEHLTNIDSKDSIVDSTDLTDILNINGDEKVTIDGNKVIFENKGDEIYYSGKSNKELPIDMAITYKLNGEDISLDDLLGKSGHVDIKVSYSNKDSHVVNVNGKNKTLYTPFVVTLGTIIPTKNVSNVEVTNGHVTSTGNSNVVIAIATPGLYNSLLLNDLKNMNSITISYDVKNFNLNQIYSVVTPKLLDSNDLKSFNKLDNLYSKVNLLTSSTNQLVDGSNKLRNGIDTLSNGINTLNTVLDNSIKNAKEQNTEEQVASVFTDEYKAELGNQVIESLTKKLASINQMGAMQIPELNGMTFDSLATTCSMEDKTKIPSKLLPFCVAKKDDIANYLKYKNLAVALQNPSTNYLVEAILREVTPEVAYNAAVSATDKAKKETISSLEVLSENINKLNEGAKQINEGASSLANGLTKFNDEGISLIAKYVNGDLKDTSATLEKLVELGDKYNTYTMANDCDSAKTKFVLVVDKKEKAVAKHTTKKETKVVKKSLWDKLTGIFK